MSLRAVHVTFIVLASLLSLSIGAWAFGHYRHGHNGGYLTMAVLALAFCGLLVVYGIWFVAKSRGEGKRE